MQYTAGRALGKNGASSAAWEASGSLYKAARLQHRFDAVYGKLASSVAAEAVAYRQATGLPMNAKHSCLAASLCRKLLPAAAAASCCRLLLPQLAQLRFQRRQLLLH